PKPAAPKPAAPKPAAPAPIRLAGNAYPVDLEGAIVASGTAIGLPGGDAVFGQDNFVQILTGRNRISKIGDRTKHFLDLRLVRLVKDPITGRGSFLPVQRVDEVIRLAGTQAAFDLGEWDIDAELQGALDVSTKLAFAAGLEALRDAGIPLVRTYKTTANGKMLATGCALAQPLPDG